MKQIEGVMIGFRELHCDGRLAIFLRVPSRGLIADFVPYIPYLTPSYLSTMNLMNLSSGPLSPLLDIVQKSLFTRPPNNR
jgi:hypothetical protein